jgi:hypothetical protein
MNTLFKTIKGKEYLNPEFRGNWHTGFGGVDNINPKHERLRESNYFQRKILLKKQKEREQSGAKPLRTEIKGEMPFYRDR